MNDYSGEYDHIFQTKLDSWVLIRKRFHELFNQREIDLLDRSERSFQNTERLVAFLSFENRYASLGGLAAVARLLPKRLMESGENVVFITPYHTKNRSVQKALEDGILVESFRDIVFHLCDYEGMLTCYKDVSAEFPSYYLQLKDHFCAGENIYIYQDKADGLLLDALAFAAAVPFAMNKLGYKSNILFHSNDWETALVAITSKLAVISNVLKQARTVLTLHNSFDTGLPIKFKKLFFGKDLPGETVLQCSLPLLNGPLTTVSTPFAHELCHDSLQRGIFTSHLQTAFSINPPIGIENGMFGEQASPFSVAALSQATSGDFTSILNKKHLSREQFIYELSKTKNSGIIGKLEFDSKTDVPIFFMSGRLDIMQKGFDAIFHAFEKLPRGSAKLFFCPSSSSDKNELQFFEQVANRCFGDIVIWPFRISYLQYETFLRGASFLLMPSFYEPFGAATEGLMHGTPVLARGTGGLWVQVHSNQELKIPSFYGNILDIDKRTGMPTGILYREEYALEDAGERWRELLQLELSQRPTNPLYHSMIISANDALQQAITIFSISDRYASMIVNGIDAVKVFSWERAVRKYRKVYDTAVFRGT
jgi:glycogen synthase